MVPLELITGSAAIIQFSVLWYLIKRNALFDRINAVTYLPLVLQEAVHALLWLAIHPGEDGISCDLLSLNWVLSFLQLLLVVGLPWWWALLEMRKCDVLMMSDDMLEHSGMKCFLTWFNLESTRHLVWPQHSLLKTFHRKTRFGLCHTQFLLGIFFMYHSVRSFYPVFAGGDYNSMPGILVGPICTVQGVTGFQVWPMAVYPYGSIHIVFVGYFGLIASTYRYPSHPSLVPWLMDLYVMLGLFLYMLIGTEWASVWSLARSFSCICALVEPFVFRTCRVLDADLLSPGEDALRQGRVFKLAWERLQTIRLTPWGKLAQDAADVNKPVRSTNSDPPGVAPTSVVMENMTGQGV